MYKIEEITDHDSLNSFYEINELEISDDEPVGTDALKSWKISYCDEDIGCGVEDRGEEGCGVEDRGEEGRGGEDSSKDSCGGESVEGVIAGAATLAARQGEYILDGIAVDSKHRGEFLGTKLLDKVVGEIKARGGSRLFLVARAPEFFRAYGFRIVARDDAPMFFECFGCEQYNVKCFPEVMRYDIL